MEDTSEIQVPRAVLASEKSPQKLRTTKETGTKENMKAPSEVIRLRVPTLENEVSIFNVAALTMRWENEEETTAVANLKTAFDERLEANDQRKETPLLKGGLNRGCSQEMRRFIGTFRHLYGIHRPDGEIPPLRHEDYALLQRRLAHYSLEELEVWLPPFFACNFGYIRRRNWSVGSYLESLAILKTAQASKQKHE